MSKPRPASVRKTRVPTRIPVQPPAPILLDDFAAPPAPRPAIWADGKQGASFKPMAFAEAGMLLARETTGAALDYMSTEAAAKAAKLEQSDWRPENRLGRVLPSAPTVSRSLDSFAQHAGAARRLLYGVAEPVPPTPDPPEIKPTPPASAAPSRADPDLAAIRAMLHDSAPLAPRRPGASQSVSWETPPEPVETAPILRKVLDWSVVRVLAGGVLVFATPIGYGRALYRHLDGTDLREIVADCHRIRIN